MEDTQMILPTQIREVLSSNEISQIQLKDGTILRITDSNIPQYNIASQEVQQSSSMNSVELEEKEGGHNHHKGMGYFGHHFKTQYYNNLCADCMTGGGVVKKRKNYVLYVSKNCTENDVALKHKLRKSEKQQIQENIQTVQEQIKENIEEEIKENIEEQIKENIEEEIKENIEEQIKENIEEQIKENIEEEIKEQEQIPVQVEENQIEQKENEEQLKNNEGEGQPEEIIMEGYVECNDVPILEEKIILRKDSNNKQENLCNECKNETENINNIETNENICNECKEEINMENNEQQQNNIEHINNEEVNVEENNMNNIQSNEEGEEMNQVEQENINEEGEEENICDDGMNQNEQQNEGNEEQKLTKTVEVLIPENQNEN